ncbi:MAG: SIS domain-containing protein [Fervidobacterium sp.]
MKVVPEEVGKFPYHMMREIHEQPTAIEATLSGEIKQAKKIAEIIHQEKYEMIYITGSGTSYHAGLAGTYSLSLLTKLIASLIPASEFGTWLSPAISKKALLIAISQSGESKDIIEAVRIALKRNMQVIALTNTPQSSLAKMANYTLLTHAGEEFAVAATKSYTAQLAALFMLILEVADLREEKTENIEKLKEMLAAAPKFVNEIIIHNREIIRDLAYTFKRSNYFFLLGSGPNYATALEGALKLKETCNVFAEGFASREFLHGPIQLIDGRTPILFIVTEDEIMNFIGLMQTITNFGAPLITISEKVNRLSEVSTNVIHIPEGFPKVFSPILYIIPLQLFAYHSSIVRNLNPDKPEKLRKVVK